MGTPFTIPGLGTFDIAGEFFSALKQGKDDAGDLAVNLKRVEGASREINNLFGGARQRIQEIKIAVADATPGISRLGGTMNETVDILRAVSEATRRNVIASTEDITKIFAASEVTGQQYGVLIENLSNVGIQFSRVGAEVQQSVNYIMSVGANTKQVFDAVIANTDRLNQFNFQNGIQGLTRMATQASVLKLDMSQVFELADKALQPEKAVELASTFQRLGVSVGDLTDPFRLMYNSLMNPEGLQQAVIDMTKQFTTFNEETKRFEILPQGKLMLAEIGRETGLAANEMSKLALNTAEMDRKLSMLKPEISFASEEDKMLFANIARMDDLGRMVVDIQEPEGKKTYEVGELTNERIQNLIEIQKQAPKDLEEIQRRQLNTQDILRSDVRALVQRAMLGAVSSEKMMELTESLRSNQIASSSLLERTTRNSGKEVRKAVNEALGRMGDFNKKIGEFVTGKNNDIIGLMTTAFTELGTKMKEKGGQATNLDLSDVTTIMTQFQSYFKDKQKEFELIRDATTPMSTTQLATQGGYQIAKEREIQRETLSFMENVSARVDPNYSFNQEYINKTVEAITNSFDKAIKQGTINSKVDHSLKINDWNINIVGSAELQGELSKNLKALFKTDEFSKEIFEAWQRASKDKNQ